MVRTGWQYLPALPVAPVYVPQGRRGAYGPTSIGYALNSGFTEPSPRQVSSYQWHATVVCELDTLTDAWNLARRRALDRLTEEALQVGADAVVGVHLHRSDHDLGRSTIEYVVTGTAIRLPGSDGSSFPLLTDVSVQDYWRLRAAGHEPVGFLATTAVVFASPPRATRMTRARRFSQNQELEEVGRAFQAARDTARARLLGQVSDAHGTGAVGVEFSHHVHRDKLALGSSLTGGMPRGWYRGRLGIPYRVTGRGDVERRGWVITMHAAGTAIRSRADRKTPEIKTSMRMRSS
ncbi:MAG: heavy metal-binding domain-containing protein [Solirubrobacterales bacterium]|nr:heavy metal-binding domain-containing protein [Solirubrobacterales bacterium]